MKKVFLRVLLVVLAMAGIVFPAPNSFAEEETTTASPLTSISLTPVSKILQIASNSTYDDSFLVKNDGDAPIKVEVYSAPYSYIHSEDDDQYRLGFSNENNFTQISRWITIKDSMGNYTARPVFSIAPHESLEIAFRITTPNNIPAGGQYAVIFAHTLSGSTNGSGIRTEASPGMVVYGRSTEGEAVISATISDVKIEQGAFEGKDGIIASAKVKNSGNVDFNAIGTLKVEPILGFSSYESPVTSGRVSIIPEAELTVSDSWTEVPSFGLYKATWTVTVGEETETTEKVIFRVSPLIMIMTIILLTIIAAWIIISFKRRKERRSRLAV